MRSPTSPPRPTRPPARRRRTRLVGGLVAFLLAVGAAPVYAADEVPNASVELAGPLTPTAPLGWSSDTWGGAKATFSWPTPGYEGDRYLRAEVSDPGSGDAKWWSDPFAAPSADKVWVSDVYRASVPTTLMVLWLGPANQQQFAVIAAAAPAADWTSVGGTVSVPTWAEQMRVMHVIGAVGWLDTDSYGVAAASPGPDVVQTADADAGAEDSVDPNFRPIVSLTFDDGWLSAYHKLIPEMNKRKLPGSHYIVAGFADTPGYGADYVSSDYVLQLARDGHEIGSHTMMHDNLVNLPIEQVLPNLQQSKQILGDFGINIVGFVPPFGEYNDAVQAHIETTYAYSRTVKAGINVEPYMTYELWGVVVTAEMTVADLAGWVEQARQMHGWLILIFHRADEDPPSESFVRPSVFAAMMDHLVAVDADVRPVGEVLGVWQWQPPVEEVVDVQTGKGFDQPDGVGKAYSAAGGDGGDGSDDGCTAGRRGGGAGALALVFAFSACLFGVMRRHRA